MKDYSKYFKPDLKEAAKRSKEKIQIIRDSILIDEETKKLFTGKKYLVRTFGCQANERDGEVLSGILEDMGCIKENDLNKLDILILNTCAVREGAEDRVFGEVGHIKKLKEVNPNLIFGICGCMAQQDNVVENIINKYKQVDLVFGTHNITDLPNLLKEIIINKERVIKVYSKEGEIYECLPSRRTSNIKAYVNIMYGCDKFCTYCIVPYTRGKERSRLIEDVLDEVNDLINKGYKQITLLGQNVNAYGNDLNLGYDFETLLRRVSETNIERVSFTTSHPWNFTDGMINVIKTHPNIMPYVHLPLQSGSDEILKKMGRRYTQKEYLDLYHKIRNEIPNVTISTDIIVGFPNETDEDFLETMKVVNECKYDSAFTFIYSPRPGTPAAKMIDKISLETKQARLDKLLEAVRDHSNERNQPYEGKILDVLVEGYSKTNDKVLTGYSHENKLVNFIGEESSIGKIVKVKITKAKSFSLDGMQIK